MTTIECPWCEEPLEADLATAVDVTCETCIVSVQLAADPTPVLAVAA